ncbi:MAG: hypothetical protein AAF487_03270 [Bacteroidota bacterium]
MKQKQVNLIATLAVTLIMNTMSNTIQRLVLSIFALCMSAFLCAQETGGKEAFVIQIENLSEDQNVEIFRHFIRDQEVRVINTCQELGLVVFQVQSKSELGALGASHSVRTLLKNRFGIENAKLLSSYSQNDVNVDCRAKKQELIEQE